MPITNMHFWDLLVLDCLSTLAAIQRAFNDAGLIFLEPGDIRDGGYGIRMKD